MTESLFEQAVKKSLDKNLKESIKDMLAQNLASVKNTPAPGEFSPEEITDLENLINKGDNANTSDFNEDECCANCCGDADVSLTVAIKDEESPLEDHNPLLDISKILTGGRFEEAVTKSLEKSKLFEADYAGPLSYVPDTRISVSDVLNAIKNELGQDALAVNVVKEQGEDKTAKYIVSQVDEDKLPKELTVVNTVLKLEDGAYVPTAISEDYPLFKA